LKIPAYLGDGALLDMNLAYLMMNLPFGLLYPINQAYPFVKDAVVTFGFPDILFKSDDAFVHLLSRQTVSEADVILGTFPANYPQKVDMVDVDDDSRVLQVVIKSS
jgi:glucose-1-phosphate thymidylyltransferase